MPVRIPSLIPGTVSTATATAADLSHGAQGLGRLASGFAELGQTFQTIADREQSIVNARHESETRLAIQTEHADFLQKLSQNNNPEDYLPAYETHAAKLQTYLQNDDHSPQTNQRLHLWLNQYTGQNKIHVAELAHNLNRKRASLALDNELTAAKNSGDQYAYESALNLGTESGLLLPEQKQKLLTDYQTETTYNTITAQIDTDPAAALEQLSSEDIQTRYPTLGKENIARLTAYATKRKHEDTSLIMDRLTMDAIDGKYLPEEEIKKLHTDGTLTAAQASAYISRARSAAPPEYDATSYDLAQKTILTYDPKQDPDGFQLATLRTQLATLPLPPEHIRQLKKNLDDKTSSPDTPKHKLATYFSDVIENEWKAEAFGDWFDMEKDPADGRIARKIIKHDQYAAALDYKLKLQSAFHTWLETQGDDLTPDIAMKKYRELKTQAVNTLPPITLAPPPVETYNPDLYLDEESPPTLQQNQDPAASPPTTSAIGTFGGQKVYPPGIYYRGAATSIFGGESDPEDNGLSAFGGKNNATAGVAIPQKMLQQMFPGKSKDWHAKNVKIVVQADNGKKLTLPLIDYGTAEWVTRREGKHKLDLNPKAVIALGGRAHYKNGKLTHHTGFKTVNFAITAAKQETSQNTTLKEQTSAWFEDQKPTSLAQIQTGLTALTDTYYQTNFPI